MQIEHIAIWTNDLERMRSFYMTYFNAISSNRYHNPTKGFYSYFLSFGAGKSRLELMQMDGLKEAGEPGGYTKGMAHFAISVGGREAVNQLTERFRANGYTVAGEPRTSGDGYYESVILDPEENRVELMA